MLTKPILTILIVLFISINKAVTKRTQNTEAKEVEKIPRPNEGLLVVRRKIFKVGQVSQEQEELPRRKRIKRKYAGVGIVMGRYNNPSTQLLEKDPTFMKVTSARILRSDQNKKETKGRIRNTSRIRRNFQKERRQSLYHLRNKQTATSMEDENKKQEENDDDTNILISKNPVMSVITLLD